jgi:hypothetical protein
VKLNLQKPNPIHQTISDKALDDFVFSAFSVDRDEVYLW